MPNGFMSPGGGSAPDIILRAKGTEGTIVEASLNGKTFTGAIGPGGFVDIKLKELGAYSVTVNRNEYNYTEIVNVYQYGITEFLARLIKPFSECSPEEIQQICNDGTYSKFWERGDKVKITLNDQQEIYVVIADFDHDFRVDGSKIPLTLVMENCLNSHYDINTPNSSAGGWASAQFRSQRLPEIRKIFPDEWIQIITKCHKYTSAGNGSSSIQTTEDDLFLLSEVEVFGEEINSYPGQGELYPIFVDSSSRIKSSSSGRTRWWLRSPDKGNNVSFCYVDESGTSQRQGSYNYYGIALGFCVG